MPAPIAIMRAPTPRHSANAAAGAISTPTRMASRNPSTTAAASPTSAARPSGQRTGRSAGGGGPRGGGGGGPGGGRGRLRLGPAVHHQPERDQHAGEPRGDLQPQRGGLGREPEPHVVAGGVRAPAGG